MRLIGTLALLTAACATPVPERALPPSPAAAEAGSPPSLAPPVVTLVPASAGVQSGVEPLKLEPVWGLGARPTACLLPRPRRKSGVGDDVGAARYYDPFVAAVGLVPLRKRALPAGSREVRVWVSSGPNAPRLVRITDIPEGGVTGEVALFFPTGPRPDGVEGTIEDWMRRTLRGQCDDFRAVGPLGSCRQRFREPPDWAAALHRAEAAGLWTLPGESFVTPCYRIQLDGWGMTVELRDGEAYRAYEWRTPGLIDAPEARRASEVGSVFSELAWAPPPQAGALER